METETSQQIEKEITIFSFYGEKGGIGKTTLCITLAYKFAQRGKRVLIYDCDAQQGLTAWIFGGEIRSHFGGHLTNFVNNIASPRTLYDQMIDERSNQAANAIKVKDYDLYVVPGSHDTNKLDAKISFDETRSSGGYGLNNVNNVTGKPYNCIIVTAKKYDIDYVFLDLSPYAGLLNRCLIMASNYLIIPTIPDLFSFEMIKNMEEILKKWSNYMDNVMESTMNGMFPLPRNKPKFLGYIMNRYIPLRKGEISDGLARDIFRDKENKWVEKIKQQANSLTNNLSNLNLAVPLRKFYDVKRTNLLGFVREYYSLKNVSDEVHVPVPFLTNKDFKAYSLSTVGKLKGPQMYETDSIREFSLIYDLIAENIELAIKADKSVSV